MTSVTQAPTPLTVSKYFPRKSTPAKVLADGSDKKVLFMDQVRDFAVRDLKRINPGDKVFFLHVPNVEEEDIDLMDSKLSTSYMSTTIVEVTQKSHYDLHPRTKGNVSSSPALEEKHLILMHETDYGVQYRYASDAGVIPYGASSYNSTNFTVLASDLEAAGVELVLESSPEYNARIEQINTAYLNSDKYKYDCELEDYYARCGY